MPGPLIISSRALGKPLNLCESVSFINKMKMVLLRWFTEAYRKGVLLDWAEACGKIQCLGASDCTNFIWKGQCCWAGSVEEIVVGQWVFSVHLLLGLKVEGPAASHVLLLQDEGWIAVHRRDIALNHINQQLELWTPSTLITGKGEA